MAEDNVLQVRFYKGPTVTQRISGIDLQRQVSIGTLQTMFPFGLFGEGRFFIACDPTEEIGVKLGDRVTVYNGLEVAYEGEVSLISYSFGDGGNEGVSITSFGYWGTLMEKSFVSRRWCDMRISDDVWELSRGETAEEKANTQRQDQGIKIYPEKQDIWSNNDTYALKYNMPTGEVVGRVSFGLDHQEASQNWQFRIRDRSGAFNFVNRTSSTPTPGTPVSYDVDNGAGTPSGEIFMEFINNSGGDQQPATKTDYYSRVTDLKVFAYDSAHATVPNPQLDTICKDAVGSVGNLNVETAYINTPSNPLALEPFVSDGTESWASVLARAASFGDADLNQWVVRLIEAAKAAPSDGKPVLECKQFEDLSDYDYIVRLGSPNVLGPIEITRDVGEMGNWFVVKYTDVDTDKEHVITPDDDSTLKDQPSIDEWEQRDYIIELGIVSEDMAKNFAKKQLAKLKRPQWVVDGPITVSGYIEGKSGEIVPASLIRSGKRIKIANFNSDVSSSGDSNSNLTFYIAETVYNDATETCQITTGTENKLGLFLAQQSLGGAK